MVAELFGARNRILVPSLHTPREGLFLRTTGVSVGEEVENLRELTSSSDFFFSCSCQA